MTLINQNSIIGVTSITSTASSDVITFHTSDTTERLRIDTSGNATFGGNVSVAGVLTYEDVTSVDAVGLSTFQNGIHVTGGSVGIGTDNISFGKLQVTQSSDTDEGGIGIVDSTISRSMRLYCNATNAVINSGNGGSGTLILNEGTGRIGIGTDDPTAGTDGESDDLVIHRASGAAGMTIKTASNTTGAIRFADPDGASQGRIEYNHPSDYLRWNTGGSEKLRIDSSGNLSLAGDTDTYIGHPASDTLSFTTANSEKLRITSTGNVGIGTINPTEKLTVNGNLIVGNITSLSSTSPVSISLGGQYVPDGSLSGSNLKLKIYEASSGDAAGLTALQSNGLAYISPATGPHTWYTQDGGLVLSERMRIAGNGNVGIATDNPATLLDVRDTITQSDNVGFVRILNDTVSTGSASNTSLIVQSNNVRCQFFAWEASGIRMGVRNKLNTGSGNVYITAGNDIVRLSIDAATGNFTGSASADISDGRLKENIQNISATDAVNIIKGLQGRTFTWKAEANMGTDTKYGFIAQEVESILPNLVHQNNGINRVSKDVDKQGYGQGEIIDDYSDSYKDDTQSEWSKSVEKTGIIPILVEALKDSIAKIETLESEVASLKAAQ